MTSSKLRPGAYVQVTHSPRDTGIVLAESDPRAQAERDKHIVPRDDTTPVLWDAGCKSRDRGEVALVYDRYLEPQRQAERDAEPEAGG